MDQLDNISEEPQVAPILDSSCELKTWKSQLVCKIHAIGHLDDFFFEVRDEIHNLFEVEQTTLYSVDREKRELYSKVTLDSLEGIQEIRVPISEESISGYCALYGKVVNVADAYDEAELTALSPRLTFDPSWDERIGFRTRQVLSVPILFERKYLMGVLVLLNRKEDGKFSKVEEEQALEVAEILSMTLGKQRTRTCVGRRFNQLIPYQSSRPNSDI